MQETGVQSLGLGRSPREGNGNPLQYSCLGNPMDRGAWWATVHEVTKESDMTQQLENNNKLVFMGPLPTEGVRDEEQEEQQNECWT